MSLASEYAMRRAPYAPISALREFFERMRDMSPPPRIDRRFLQKLNVASNNEWALLSALKFLGVVDEHGSPTHSYRLLQTTDQFRETLAHLVRQAYRDLFDSGLADKSMEELRNYFRVTSSPSQAKNAARFFREVCSLAGLCDARTPIADPRPSNLHQAHERVAKAGPAVSMESAAGDRLAAKARLLEKLPPPRANWTADEYRQICDAFLRMLDHLSDG